MGRNNSSNRDKPQCCDSLYWAYGELARASPFISRPGLWVAILMSSHGAGFKLRSLQLKAWAEARAQSARSRKYCLVDQAEAVSASICPSHGHSRDFMLNHVCCWAQFKVLVLAFKGPNSLGLNIWKARPPFCALRSEGFVLHAPSLRAVHYGCTKKGPSLLWCPNTRMPLWGRSVWHQDCISPPVPAWNVFFFAQPLILMVSLGG